MLLILIFPVSHHHHNHLMILSSVVKAKNKWVSENSQNEWSHFPYIHHLGQWPMNEYETIEGLNFEHWTWREIVSNLHIIFVAKSPRNHQMVLLVRAQFPMNSSHNLYSHSKRKISYFALMLFAWFFSAPRNWIFFLFSSYYHMVWTL